MDVRSSTLTELQNRLEKPRPLCAYRQTLRIVKRCYRGAKKESFVVQSGPETMSLEIEDQVALGFAEKWGAKWGANTPERGRTTSFEGTRSQLKVVGKIGADQPWQGLAIITRLLHFVICLYPVSARTHPLP